mmetsp:Transcript_1116/g.1613  ORF Transcript_1116/g.1613 Transcript_1116/m.1613 type:complete len:274 (+) Transcript_1116:89-910(+)
MLSQRVQRFRSPIWQSIVKSTTSKRNSSVSAWSRVAGRRQEANNNANWVKSAIVVSTTGSACLMLSSSSSSTDTRTQCDYQRTKSLRTLAGDVVMLGPTKEPGTGILFPRLCNGLTFVGCGVRIKYGFIKIYAVGTYMDPIAMSAIKKESPEAIGEALLDPMYPRTIRIVMNRGLSSEKFSKALAESLVPRMNGKDLHTVEEFKKMNPPGDLVEGAEMEITIRGDHLLYKNSAGGVGAIRSEALCRAFCDTYYGKDAVSPGHRQDVIAGIPKL